MAVVKKAVKKKAAPKKKAASKKAAPKKKAVPKKSITAKKAAIPKASGTNEDIASIKVRMYRAGTGDFFLLLCKTAKGVVQFNIMIDCGCINAGNGTFTKMISDLSDETGGVIDLLVVTHEHADHINGFRYSADQFDKIIFKKVWFAWTEDDADKTANDYRKNNTKLKLALAAANQQLTTLKNNQYYETTFKNQFNYKSILGSQEHYAQAVSDLAELNGANSLQATKTLTMVDLLRQYKVIKDKTVVEFLSPGDLIENLQGLANLRFFVLGPPTDLKRLGMEEKKGEGYEKRESKSTVDFAFVDALTTDSPTTLPFDSEYEITGPDSDSISIYNDPDDAWRRIDYDWLYGAGGLALRLQTSINNTSLVLAVQFMDSEKVLLLPGDAEYGNWTSWHDKELTWTIPLGGKATKVDASYLLSKTIFYKVGHHLSQNGTAKAKGLEKMTSKDLAAMATLDFKKINSGWMNTMPNDIIGADLIEKTKGKLFFVGDCNVILKNIMTDRVSVNAAGKAAILEVNNAFKGKNYIDYEVKS